MRLKDGNGVLLALEGELYCDGLGTAYGVILSLAGVDKQFAEVCIHEEDAWQIANDLETFKTVKRTVQGYIVLHYDCTAISVEFELECDAEKIKCTFTGDQHRTLIHWFVAFKTFCENRLNETDCILPNQTVTTTKFIMSQN